MTSQPISFYKKHFRSKGAFFCCNLSLLAIVLLLIKPLFYHESWHPFFLGYSFRYFIYLSLYIVPAVFFAVVISIGNKKFQRTFFICFASLFLFFEIGLTLFPRGSITKDFTHFSKPYVMFTGKPNASVMLVDGANRQAGKKALWTMNELGLRIEQPLPKQKGEKEIRVFVVGGSAVLHGSPLVNTLSGQLEQCFHRDGMLEVKVYNCGIRSFVSGQELSLILHTLVEYQPDLVVVYDGGNDIHQPYTYDPRPGYPYNFVIYEAGFARVNGTASLAELLGGLFYKSKLIQSLFQPGRYNYDTIISVDRAKEIKQACAYRSPGWETEIITRYIGNLEKMCHLAKGFDFKLAVFLQPVIYFKTPLVGRERALLGDDDFQNYMERQYARIKPILSDLNTKYAKENRYFFADLSNTFTGYDKEVFWDFIHIDNEGNKVIAGRMYDFLKEKKILDLAHRQ